MRTRLRACARGKDYLPKEARSQPNAYARSFTKRSERNNGRNSSTTATNSNADSESDSSPSDETLNRRLGDIKFYKDVFRNHPVTPRLIAPAVVFPRHPDSFMSTNPSPTPPTSSQEPIPDFLAGPNDVCTTRSDRFSESSEVYGKIISSLRNLDDEEEMPQCPYPPFSRFLTKPEEVAETNSGEQSHEEKSQQTIPKIKLDKASDRKRGIKRKSIAKSIKRKPVMPNKSKHIRKCKIMKVCVSSTETGAQIVEASTSALPVTPPLITPPDNGETPDVDEKPVTEEDTKDEIPGTSSQVEQQVQYDYYQPTDEIPIQPYEEEAKSEPESGVDTENEPSRGSPEVISDPLGPSDTQDVQEEPMNQEADAYSDISGEEMPMEEGMQEAAEFSQFGDVNSTSDGGVTDSQMEEPQTLEEYQGNEAVASTSQASPNYEPMEPRQGMALQRPSAFVYPSTSRVVSNSPVLLLTNEDNWQQQATAVIIRDKMILEHQKWTDVVFFIGPNKQKFRAHKVYLAKSSVVFEHLLYGRSSANEIYFPDITSESFASLLQFIYEGELHLSSLKEACNMLEMAKRFILDDTVVSRCRSYIFVRIFPSSAWEVVSFAHEKNEPELFETAVKACRKLLDEENVSTASRDLLLAMFTNDALHDGVDSELSLYKACTKWANHQMTVNNASAEEIKNLIAPLLYQIRFINMSLTDCIQVCDLRPNILSDAEKLSLICFLANPQERAMPEFVSPKYEDDSDVNTTFFVYAMPHKDLGYALHLDINTYNQFSTSAFHINGESDDKTVDIIQIPTQKKCNNPNDTYTEDLTLSFKDNTCPGVLHTARFTHEVPYDSYTNITLDSPIPLKDIPSKIIEVRIIFHTTGRYPTTKEFQQDSINQLRENDPREMCYYNSGSNFMHLMGYQV